MPASNIITLGIGTPSDIPHFTLFGLSPNPSFIPPPGLVKFTALELRASALEDPAMHCSTLANIEAEVIG